MNRRFQSGTLGLATTLAIVAAAGSGSFFSTRPEPAAAPQAEASPTTTSQQRPTIPIRSGNPDDRTEELSKKPVKVRIADIGVTAAIIPVGVDSEKQLDVPSAEKVGWYQYSSSPGSSGASVLAAHVDYGGKPGAFFDQDKLVVGKEFSVELDDGSVQKYQVSANSTYDKIDLPAEELFRKEGEPVLHLITCGGSFDPEAKSYNANVVVSAIPVDS